MGRRAGRGERPVGAHHAPEPHRETGVFASAASPYTAPEMTSGPVTDLVLTSAGPPASTSRAVLPAAASAPSFTPSFTCMFPPLGTIGNSFWPITLHCGRGWLRVSGRSFRAPFLAAARRHVRYTPPALTHTRGLAWPPHPAPWGTNPQRRLPLLVLRGQRQKFPMHPVSSAPS